MADNNRKPSRTSHLTAAQRRYLHGMDDEVAYCKGTKRHRFPPLLPGRPLPKGARVDPAEGGCFQLTETCELCGRQCRRTTAPRGFLEAGTTRSYSGGGEDYIATGLDLHGADYSNELGRRLQETIRTAGKAAKS